MHKTGKLKHLFDNSFDDTTIQSKLGKQEAEKVAKQLYAKLGYQENEYEIASLERNLITEDSCLWQVDFCKKYDDLYNWYQCVRITFVPEIEKIKMLTLFDYDFENNPVEISKEQAIQIATDKATQLGKEGNRVKSITVELEIKKMNSYVYAQENPIEPEIVEIIDENTSIYQAAHYAYRTEYIVRKVWNVKIEYISDFASCDSYFVDCTTGEIIGGDALR